MEGIIVHKASERIRLQLTAVIFIFKVCFLFRIDTKISVEMQTFRLKLYKNGQISECEIITFTIITY